MLFTISAEISGGDLGYLLHKNPSRLHSFDLPFGKAHVFYAEGGPTWSQAALLLDVDPVGLVRGRVRSSGPATLHQYVNDRPYAASSFLSVAISRVFGTAMSGRSKERQPLADHPLSLEALVTALPCRAENHFSIASSNLSATKYQPHTTIWTKLSLSGDPVRITPSV